MWGQFVIIDADTSGEGYTSRCERDDLDDERHEHERDEPEQEQEPAQAREPDLDPVPEQEVELCSRTNILHCRTMLVVMLGGIAVIARFLPLIIHGKIPKLRD